MPLRDRAVVVIEAEGRRGEFHLPGAESTNDLDREMLLGNGGQVISTLQDLIPFIGGGGTNRTGYNIDAGQGRDEYRLAFETGGERSYSPDLQWGDGSAGDTKWDADPQNDHPQKLEQIFQYYSRIGTTDSRRPAKLYWGEWSDGTYCDAPGVFGEPIDAVVLNLNTENKNDDPAGFEGTATLARTDSFPKIFQSGDGSNSPPKDKAANVTPKH